MDASVIARCPHCEANILEAWVLIEYERADGSGAAYAECRRCEEIVRV